MSTTLSPIQTLRPARAATRPLRRDSLAVVPRRSTKTPPIVAVPHLPLAANSPMLVPLATRMDRVSARCISARFIVGEDCAQAGEFPITIGDKVGGAVEALLFTEVFEKLAEGGKLGSANLLTIAFELVGGLVELVGLLVAECATHRSEQLGYIAQIERDEVALDSRGIVAKHRKIFTHRGWVKGREIAE